MHEFTLNNHLTYSIGGRKYGYRENPHEKYVVDVGQIDHDYYKTSNWVEENYRIANHIKSKHGNDFVVMFSGGTDSEIVLRALKHVGASPRVVFIKFANDYNIDDFHMANTIADDVGIKLETVEFDVKNFYYSGQAAEFASEIHCRQMAYLGVYHHIRLLNMPAVMGGEMLFKRHVTKNESQWYYCFRENEDASAMRFSMKYDIPLVNEWFSYTPEIMAYYLKHPTINWLYTDRYNYKLSSVSTKNEILKELVPEIIDKKKTHGFEKLMAFNMEAYVALHGSHVKPLEFSLDGIFIDDLKVKLFGDKYDDY